MASLPTRMKAVICYGPQDYRLEEVDVPKISPKEILIRVTAVGICAGDAKCYYGAKSGLGMLIVEMALTFDRPRST